MFVFCVLFSESDVFSQVYLFLVVTLLFYVKYEWCDLLFKNNTENPECRRHYSKDTFFVAGRFFHSPSLYLCLEFIVISTDNFYVSYQAQQGIKRTSQKADQEIENIKIQKQKRNDLCEINLCVSLNFHSYLVLLLLCKIQHFWKQKSVSNGCDKHLCKSGLVKMHLLPKWRVCGSPTRMT